MIASVTPFPAPHSFSDMSVAAQKKSLIGKILNLETGSLGPIGTEDLDLRLAVTPEEIKACQRLRFQTFYEEMGATPIKEMGILGLDYDEYDDVCDHLMVLKRSEADLDKAVIGTYRFIRRDMAAKIGQFYSEAEFDMGPILQTSGEILELGRSTVHKHYRSRATMQLLWRGLAAYVVNYDVKVMFGSVSLEGVNPEEWKLALSYLYHFHLAPPALRAKALDFPAGHNFARTPMNLMPLEEISERRAISMMPPLMKGYLRVGNVVADGAVIDHQWNSVDVLMVVKTENVTDRYLNKYMGQVEEQ